MYLRGVKLGIYRKTILLLVHMKERLMNVHLVQDIQVHLGRRENVAHKSLIAFCTDYFFA